MAFAVPALSILSGGLSLVGGMQAAGQAKAAGAYQAAIARNQATINEMNAVKAEADSKTAYENAKRAGLVNQINAQDQDLSAAEQIGQERVDQSVSGVRGGSQTRVLNSLERLAGRDRERMISEGRSQAKEFRVQGQAFLSEAADLRTGAASARTDAKMIKSNASADAFQSRLTGLSGAISGFGDAGGFLLDPTKRARARSDFNNIFRRKSSAY